MWGITQNLGKTAGYLSFSVTTNLVFSVKVWRIGRMSEGSSHIRQNFETFPEQSYSSLADIVWLIKAKVVATIVDGWLMKKTLLWNAETSVFKLLTTSLGTEIILNVWQQQRPFSEIWEQRIYGYVTKQGSAEKRCHSCEKCDWTLEVLQKKAPALPRLTSQAAAYRPAGKGVCLLLFSAWITSTQQTVNVECN